MRTRTLTNLIADVRFRADNQAATDSDITELLNQSIADLYDQLCSAFGDEYFEVQNDSLVTTPGSPLVALPADFYKLTGVWWLISGSQYARIRKYSPAESEQIIPSAGWNYDGNVWYRLRVGNIRFVPTPLAAHTLRLKYVPTSVRLVNPGDTFDGYNGFEEWPIVDASIKLLEREGNTDDTQLLMQRKATMTQRIMDMADRDEAEPSRVQDTVSIQSSWRWRW